MTPTSNLLYVVGARELQWQAGSSPSKEGRFEPIGHWGAVEPVLVTPDRYVAAHHAVRWTHFYEQFPAAPEEKTRRSGIGLLLKPAPGVVPPGDVIREELAVLRGFEGRLVEGVPLWTPDPFTRYDFIAQPLTLYTPSPYEALSMQVNYTETEEEDESP